MSQTKNKIRNFVTLILLPLVFASEKNIYAATNTSSKNSISRGKTAAEKLKNVLEPLFLMQKKLRAAKSLTFAFEQKQINSALGMTSASSGRIFLLPPSKFRWQTENPDPQLIVSNGKKTWIYTPPFREGEQGQVTVRPAQNAQSSLALDLLSGRADLKKSFDIVHLKDLQFKLIPRNSAPDLASAELFVEKQTNLVYKLVLHTKSGNITELEVKNIELNQKFSGNFFEFKPPKGTQQVQ